MSERKGNGNRGSLMDLGKPRLAQSPLSAPIDEAERLILARSSSTTPARVGTDTSSSAAVPSIEAADAPQPETLSGITAEIGTLPPRSQLRESRHRALEEDLVARLRRNREPIAVVGFKLPASLKDELAAVAQHNDTDMTRIVIEALQRLLPELPHPPAWNKSAQ